MRKIDVLEYRLKSYTFDLTTAKNEELFGGSGTLCYLYDATDSDVSVNIRIDSLENDTITLKKGKGFRGAFERLYITSTAQASKSVTLLVAYEPAYDGKFEFIDNTKIVSGDVNILQNEKTATLTAAAVSVTSSATVIAASNTDRKALTIRNNDAAVTVFLGGSGVTTAAGFPLLPLEAVTFDRFTGAIYGIVASGSVDVRYAEEG